MKKSKEIVVIKRNEERKNKEFPTGTSEYLELGYYMFS